MVQIYPLRICIFHLDLSGSTFWITSLKTVLACPAPHTQFRVRFHMLWHTASSLLYPIQFASWNSLARSKNLSCLDLFSGQMSVFNGFCLALSVLIGLVACTSPKSRAYQTACQSGQESMRALASQIWAGLLHCLRWRVKSWVGADQSF